MLLPKEELQMVSLMASLVKTLGSQPGPARLGDSASPLLQQVWG